MAKGVEDRIEGIAAAAAAIQEATARTSRREIREPLASTAENSVMPRQGCRQKG